MQDWPVFPPGYEARLCLDDPFAAAAQAARDDAPDGLLLWQDREDRLDAALVLRPLDPLSHALTLSYVGLLGLHDAFAGLAPPETPAALGWPDRLLVNDAIAGGIRVACGPAVEKAGFADVPDWLVLGFQVQIAGDAADDAQPGLDLRYTSLFEEGCGEIRARQLLESLTRHLLGWLERWQDQGFEPVRRQAELRQAEPRMRLEPGGDMSIDDGAKLQRHSLRDSLARPSWQLPGLPAAP